MSHHLRWAAAATILTVGLGVGAAQYLHLFGGSDSTQLSAGEAKRRFDASTSSANPTNSVSSAAVSQSTNASPVTTSVFPAPGVYVYATTGRDSVDVMNGAHHVYPPTTTITVQSTACGTQQRWDILEQRWELWQRCPNPLGVSETGRTNYDQFFGQSQTDTWTCGGAPRPLSAATGATWSTSCTSGSATNTIEGVVVGIESQVVGSSNVDAVHVRVSITNDSPSDSQIIDTWYLAGTDLVVAQTSIVATSNASQVGTVHYAETYEIHLTSLTPLS